MTQLQQSNSHKDDEDHKEIISGNNLVVFVVFVGYVQSESLLNKTGHFFFFLTTAFFFTSFFTSVFTSAFSASSSLSFPCM